jgi:hypothetical protein
VAQRLAISCYDSQCGLKLLPAVCFESIRRDLAEDGFCIDLDILLQLERRGCLVAEFPIDWHDHSESRVRVFRDGWRMLRALNRLRRRQRAIAEVDRRELPVFSPTAQ